MDDNQTETLCNNRGFAYADGFFTTMGVHQGKILWLGYHQQRLISHSLALSLSLDLQAITNQLNAQAKQINEGILKLVITRADQTKHNIQGYGFLPIINHHDKIDNKAEDNKKNNNKIIGSSVEVIIKTIAQSMPSYHQLNAYSSKPQPPYHPLITSKIPIQATAEAICLSAKIACLPKPLVGLKSLNRLDSVLVAGELEQAKLSNPRLIEGLVADINDNWVEGVMSNVFYQLKHPLTGTTQSNSMNTKSWFTPPIDNSGVNGVMRQVIMDQQITNKTDKLNSIKPTIIERRLTTADLPHISAMFFCNAVRGIIPISKLWLSANRQLVLKVE